MGFGVAFLIDYVDNTVRTIEQIQRFGISVIGVIPKIGEKYQRRKRRSRSKKKVPAVSTDHRSSSHFRQRLVSHLEPKSPIAEAYRSIRTNLTYALPDKEVCPPG